MMSWSKLYAVAAGWFKPRGVDQHTVVLEVPGIVMVIMAFAYQLQDKCRVVGGDFEIFQWKVEILTSWIDLYNVFRIAGND